MLTYTIKQVIVLQVQARNNVAGKERRQLPMAAKEFRSSGYKNNAWLIEITLLGTITFPVRIAVGDNSNRRYWVYIILLRSIERSVKVSPILGIYRKLNFFIFIDKYFV